MKDHTRRRRLSAIVLGTVVVAGAQLLATTEALAASATLTKTGQDSATGSTTQTSHGGTVNWALGYSNTTSGRPVQAVITDPIQTGQTYVAGSLQAPPGWTRQWSPDGTTFQGTEPATVQAVRASATVANPGTGQSVNLARPPATVAIFGGSGGDGWRPIPYHAKVYNIFHHRVSSTPGLSCVDPSTGAICPGYPTYVSSQTGAPIGTGPDDLDTPFAPNDEFVDVTGRYGPAGNTYYTAQKAGTQNLGVACVNLNSFTSCGFTVIDPTAGPERTTGNNLIQASGGIQFAGHYYMYGVNARLYCMDIATRTPCPGQPFGLGLPSAFTGNNANDGGGGGRFGGAGNIASRLIGSRIISLASYDNLDGTAGAGLGDRIACFDPATNGLCAGFTPITIPNTTGNAQTDPQPANADVVFTMTPTLDGSGAENGFCVYAFNGTANRHGLECWNLTGAAVAAPATLNTTIGTLVSAQPPGEVIMSFESAEFGTRTYVPVGPYGSAHIDTYVCYDWSTGALCAGFATGGLLTFPTINGGDLRTYTIVNDPERLGCMWADGDQSFNVEFDATTGTSPCLATGTSLTLAPAAFYCDGAGNHVQGWGQLAINDLPPADITASSVSVFDQNGNPVAGFQNRALSPQGTLDLASISYTPPFQRLMVTVMVRVTTTAPWDTGQPSLTVFYTGDAAVQVCFKTTVPSTCTVVSVSNQATATTTDSAGASTTVSAQTNLQILSTSGGCAASPTPTPTPTLPPGLPNTGVPPAQPGGIPWELLLVVAGGIGALVLRSRIRPRVRRR